MSPQAGRPAARMQQLAEAHAQECCVCCLNSGLSHCRSGGDEGRKWLHVYIAELSFSPPSVSNALLFKHSQVREMTPADAGVHSSASALHLKCCVCEQSNSETPIATTSYSGCLLPQPAGLDDG